MESTSKTLFIKYSDQDLEEFKSLILSKLEAAKRELEALSGSLGTTNPNGTDDTGSAHLQLDDGTATLEKESLHQLAGRQKKFVEQLEAALIRIANKTYGICKETGQLIPKERLKAVPHTTMSMEAKLKQY